jgi:hypothetical protein
MAESSRINHSYIDDGIQSHEENQWWNISDNGSYVDGTNIIVQSDYPVRLAQERSALSYQAAAFGEQNMGSLEIDPPDDYGFNTEMGSSGSRHYSALTVPWNTARSTAPSWVAPDGTVHRYNDFSSKYLT